MLTGIDLAHERGLENLQPAQETNFTDLTKPSLGFGSGMVTLKRHAALNQSNVRAQELCLEQNLKNDCVTPSSLT